MPLYSNSCCGESGVIADVGYKPKVQKEILTCKPNPFSEELSSNALEYTGSITCDRQFTEVQLFYPGITDSDVQQDINGQHVANISDDGDLLAIQFSDKNGINFPLTSKGYCVRMR